MMIYHIDELNGFLRCAVRVGPGREVVALWSFKTEFFLHRSTSNSSVPDDRTLSTDLCKTPAGFPRRLQQPLMRVQLSDVHVSLPLRVLFQPVEVGHQLRLHRLVEKNKHAFSFPSVTLCTFKN